VESIYLQAQMSKEDAMALFGCNDYEKVYEDYYPPDDSCLRCHVGAIHIIQQPDNHESGFSILKEEDQQP
jgi:hypothetical protein